jgi:hypothetical protein
MNRVRYCGESFIIGRGGRPISEPLPAVRPRFTGSDLVTFLRSLPKPDQEPLTEVEKLIIK